MAIIIGSCFVFFLGADRNPNAESDFQSAADNAGLALACSGDAVMIAIHGAVILYCLWSGMQTVIATRS